MVDLSEYLTCRACGKKFDSLGDLQIHLTVEHMQKGDIPSCSVVAEKHDIVLPQGENLCRMVKRAESCVFYIIIILIDLILANLILPNYSRVLPLLDSRIFEVLIPVIATILGLAIIAIFYYLGKFEDLKMIFVDSFIAIRRTLENRISDQEKILNTIKDVLEKETHNTQSPTKNAVSELLAEVQRSRNKLKDMTPRISEGVKVFEDASAEVRADIILTVISFGLAILSCFIGLFLAQSHSGNFRTLPFGVRLSVE